MNLVDALGYRVSGATPAALAAYERALAAFQSWRTGAEVQLKTGLREAPEFLMAHVLQAWQLVCSRDPLLVHAARPVLARAADLSANERERGHLAALEAVLGDDFELGKSQLDKLLYRHPRDALALHVAHALDYLTGDLARMASRTVAVLPEWSSELPGYDSVLAVHAFSLGENKEYAQAEDAARMALELNPLNARAHHVMAHVFEMTERPEEGIRWMQEQAYRWSVDTVVATHCWWHLALFHLAARQLDQALDVYDQRVRAQHSRGVADLIDAAALLWRIELAGGDGGGRWAELAMAWVPHIDDGYCSFTDLHAMLAFVGARDWDNARSLEQVLLIARSKQTRYGASTQLLGLPACRALIAYGRGNDALAITLLSSLPPLAHRLGGSHAQRDVLNMTLRQAHARIRRPTRSPCSAALPIAASA